MLDSQHIPYYPQAAAIPFKFDDDGELWVLMTLREGKQKWGIPKGFIDEGYTAREMASIESLEEAGIAGRVSNVPVASFKYRKWRGWCGVAVFLLEVVHEYPTYMERRFRQRQWFRLADALALPARAAIPDLLAHLPALIRQQQMAPEPVRCD